MRDAAVDKIREEQLPFCTSTTVGLQTEAEMILERFTGARVPKLFTFVEVGASYGDCTLFVHALLARYRIQMRAIAFESNPMVVPFLRGNLLINGLDSEVAQVRSAFVSHRANETQRLLAPASSVHASGLSTSQLDGDSLGRRDGKVFEVGTTTLDEELHGERIDLLLITVPGELEVLDGARR